MRRRLVWILIILVILVVGIDRIAWKVAEGELASRIQNSEGLDSTPDVSIGGFPFLTQVFGGTYKSVDATVEDLSVADGTTIDSVKVHLTGMRVPFKQLVRRDLDTVNAKTGTVTGVVSYDSIDAVINAGLVNNGLEIHVSQGRSGANQLALTGTLSAAGVKQQISGDVAIDISGGAFTITVPQDSLGVPQALRNRLVKLLQVSHRLPPLPLGLEISQFTSAPGGIAVTATGKNVLISASDLG